MADVKIAQDANGILRIYVNGVEVQSVQSITFVAKACSNPTVDIRVVAMQHDIEASADVKIIQGDT